MGRCSHEKWWNDGHKNGQHHDRRNVVARELINEALGGCALTLCLLDGGDDARQGGVILGGGDAIVERAAFINRAGEHRIARLLGDRHALAGDRCLVDGGLSLQHGAIKRDTLARLDPHYGAQRHGLSSNLLPRAVTALHRCKLRRHRH